MNIKSVSNYSNHTTFNAGVKNSKVLEKVLEHASEKELARFNAILDAMPLRFDGKVYDFVKMLSNGIHKLCMDDVVREEGALKYWHSSDLAEGRVIKEVYSKSLKRANDILGRTYLYPTDKIKDAPREVTLAEIYTKLA